MATFDAADFCGRLIGTFPTRWAGRKAFAPPSAPGARDAHWFYAVLFSAGQQLAFLMTAWAYVRLQTRLATATDSNLDLASQDFFAGRLPRIAGEDDPTFSARLRARLIAPSGCFAGVMAAITGYFKQYPDATLTGVDIFDQQSDPKRAAFYFLQNAQFAVIFYHPITTSNLWRVGRAALGQTTIVADPNSFTLSLTCPYPGLASLINDAKDWTYEPVYITSLGEPISLQS